MKNLKKRREVDMKEEKNRKKGIILITLLIVLIGVFLRWWH